MLFDLGNSASGSQFFITALAYILVIILSLSLHEFAHAFTAYKCGDQTPKMQGRVSLNPLKHMDPIGMICCAFFRFGWARPVEINPSNFRNIKKGIAWTSVAGVLMNLFLSFWGYGLFALTLLIPSSNFAVQFIQEFFFYLFQLNICLAVFNLLPIYPLDGFKLVEVSTKYNNNYVNFMYKYGYIILIIIVLFCENLLFRLISWVSYPITLFWGLIF